MPKEEIVIVIEGDKVSIDNVCGSGASCEKTINELLKAVGGKVKNRTKKPSYYQGSGQKKKQTIQRGDA